MTQVTTLGRVLVPVADQDKAIAFYTQVGFFLRDQDKNQFMIVQDDGQQ